MQALAGPARPYVVVQPGVHDRHQVVVQYPVDYSVPDGSYGNIPAFLFIYYPAAIWSVCISPRIEVDAEPQKV